MELQFTVRVEADEEGWADMVGTPFTRENVTAHFKRVFEAEIHEGIANEVTVTPQTPIYE